MCRLQNLSSITLLAFTTLSTEAQGRTFTLSSEPVVPSTLNLTYNPADGNLSYSGGGSLVSAIELLSATGLFDPTKVNSDVISGPFDVFTPAKFFKLVTDGVASVDIGPVFPTGLKADPLLPDLQVDASLKPSGYVGPPWTPYLYIVPEPPSICLTALGLFILLFRCRSSINASWPQDRRRSQHA
jgi:hypothetical protein